MDIILFQRINGGWEYRYIDHQWGEDDYIAFDYDPATARRRLRLKLGWSAIRFNRADFRRF